MSHQEFLSEIRNLLPEDRVYTDSLRRFAWGTDAGFYRLVPRVVLRSASEGEVSRVLQAASAHGVPVTFRAAGTSLSGQSVSDSVLLVAGKNWEGMHTPDEGLTVVLQPGVVGSKVNDFLKPYGRKFGPDPASIKSCMVGGIVMNNASGMSCGTWANSDRMLLSGRIIFADGTQRLCAPQVTLPDRDCGHRGRLLQQPHLRDRSSDKLRHSLPLDNLFGQQQYEIV